ncbi:type II toxin-antitoxin system RelE/ParE family toxin [Cyclobacterium amurskyense]|uniref:Plasmid stabilization system protein n=1 Tax=Cyclobacterium amurskyense TaxID=320787 RepID=A0A0H4P9Y0_9BACT|nr:type II toxin-antitoxin system RelE/ParE family toxin [Cyclobacterium amurskyense]AKP51281.1 Plasmid stabilization system protein [Cyclobacterium amurskyense]|tara:strand:+ start:15034 stop:15333 length:300 start_codon:yes stop_codon:yes gene_type:complete
MYNSEILPFAKKDISEAASWYNSKEKGLGNRFIQAVRNKVMLIRQNPKISSIRYDTVQTAVLDIFPFMIHYTVDDFKKIVIIVGVFHTSLDPGRWTKRK